MGLYKPYLIFLLSSLALISARTKFQLTDAKYSNLKGVRLLDGEQKIIMKINVPYGGYYTIIGYCSVYNWDPDEDVCDLESTFGMTGATLKDKNGNAVSLDGTGQVSLSPGESEFTLSFTGKMNYASMLFSDNPAYELTFVNLDTSDVTDMTNMFQDMENLESLDLSGFNTANVEAASQMFDGCEKIKALDLSSFNTSKCTNLYMMFNGCSSLEYVDLSSFDTSKVTKMDGMFKGASSLQALNLSNFNTARVTDMHDMFNGASSLINLDISNFNIDSVTNKQNMFNSCTPKYAKVSENFRTNALSDYPDLESAASASGPKYKSGTEYVDKCPDSKKYSANYICYDTCPEGTTLNENAKMCLYPGETPQALICEATQYKKNDECHDCSDIPHCQTCEDETGCTACETPFTIGSNNTCELVCSQNQFIKNDACQNCSEHCKKCENDIGCSQCEDNYNLTSINTCTEVGFEDSDDPANGFNLKFSLLILLFSLFLL